jgi:hypothetical protein
VTVLQLLVALRPATPTITAEQVEQIVERVVERVTEQIKDDEEEQNEPENFAPGDPHPSARWDRRPQ